jgi:hypothetical protein
MARFCCNLLSSFSFHASLLSSCKIDGRRGLIPHVKDSLSFSAAALFFLGTFLELHSLSPGDLDAHSGHVIGVSRLCVVGFGSGVFVVDIGELAIQDALASRHFVHWLGFRIVKLGLWGSCRLGRSHPVSEECHDFITHDLMILDGQMGAHRRALARKH